MNASAEEDAIPGSADLTAVEIAEEAEEAEERAPPTGRIVYKTVLSEGEHELERTSPALFWSGLAAGLSMGFSLIGEALLMAHLPDAPWRPLVAKFGYCFGFLIVILGRQQLFTENTLTPILPLLVHRNLKTLGNVARLWIVVLTANLIGAVLFAAITTKAPLFDSALQEIFVEIGRADLEHSFLTTMLRGVFAGWLLALLVWVMPAAESSRIWVIIIITYLVGIAELSHVVAGSIAAFAWAMSDSGSWSTAFGGFVIPSLLGNIFGGVLLVAGLSHAQVVAGQPPGKV
ncbi:MAG: formate/nitrite transporter family protein [Rubrivivax sp.]